MPTFVLYVNNLFRNMLDKIGFLVYYINSNRIARGFLCAFADFSRTRAGIETGEPRKYSYHVAIFLARAGLEQNIPRYLKSIGG